MSKLRGDETIVDGIPVHVLLLRLREGDREAFGALFVEITDPGVLEKSGMHFHPIVTR